jgi:hypothetical protein
LTPFLPLSAPSGASALVVDKFGPPYLHAGGSPFTEQMSSISKTIAKTKQRNPTT